MDYILDADWIIQALAGDKKTINKLQNLRGYKLAVSLIQIGEIYEEAYTYANPEEQLKQFQQFLRPFEILNLNEPIMQRFAEIRSYLRRKGEIIQDFDILLAATAQHHNLTILTYNKRHLDRIPNLRTE